LLTLPDGFFAWRNLDQDITPAEEAQSAKPSLDWGICLKIGALVFFTMDIIYLPPTRLPFLLKEIGKYSPTIAGIAIAAFTLAEAVASRLAGLAVIQRLNLISDHRSSLAASWTRATTIMALSVGSLVFPALTLLYRCGIVHRHYNVNAVSF